MEMHSSALHDVDGQAAAGGLLVLGEHVLTGLTHGLDDGVQRYCVTPLAPQCHASSIDRLDGRHRIAPDAGDLHEPEFQKEGLSIEFGVMETLESFSGVSIAELSRKEIEGVEFLLPTAEQFLAIYRASSQDSYRNDNNNRKDFAKIAYLEKMIK